MCTWLIWLGCTLDGEERFPSASFKSDSNLKLQDDALTFKTETRYLETSQFKP